MVWGVGSWGGSGGVVEEGRDVLDTCLLAGGLRLGGGRKGNKRF
jgi:hypothetical protein